MAVKINLMPEKAKNDWQGLENRSSFYSFFLALFIISILIFSGIFFYKNYYLQKQLDDFQSENISLTGKILKNFEPKFALTNTKAKNAQKLLSNHLYWSNFFQTMEDYSLKSITYSQLAIDAFDPSAGNISVKLSGQAADFKSLAKQLAVFRKNKDFPGLGFDGAELDKDGKVYFSIKLNFNPSIIKFKKEGEIK